MAKKEAMRVDLSERQQKILTEMKHGTHMPSHYRQRAEIIILANEKYSNNEIERKMGIHGETITKWRNRYAGAKEELVKIETDEPLKLRSCIKSVLSDAPRPGKPATFTDEQVACIIAMSCQDPSEYKLPFSHWTSALLREEAIKTGIVVSISTMQISRFLKREGFKTTSG
jgi:transposase